MDEAVFRVHMVKNDLEEFVGGQVILDRRLWNSGVAIIWLDNVEQKNAFTGKMMVDFMRCLRHLARWKEGKAVIICGRGDHFCSGIDINFERENLDPINGNNLRLWMMGVLKAFSTINLITVCAIRGECLGGGAEIAAYCDFVLVAEDAIFGYTHGRMGLTPFWGGAAQLIKKIGYRTALKAFLTSKTCNAQECRYHGLADHKVNSSTLIESTLIYSQKFIRHHHTVTRSYKRIVNISITEGSVDKTVLVERLMSGYLWGQGEHRRQHESYLRTSVDQSAPPEPLEP